MNELDNMKLDFSNFEINNAIRLPVVLLIDASGSMKYLMPEVNNALKSCIKALQNDMVSAKSVELCVMFFNQGVNIIQDFEVVDKIKNNNIAEATATGATFTGGAILKALDLANERKIYYQNNSRDYYQPWLVIMTDGMPSVIDDTWLKSCNNSTSSFIVDELNALNESREMLHELINNKKLNLISVAIGEDADVNYLKSLHPKGIALKSITGTDLDFSQFFNWLGKTVKVKTNSQDGESVTTLPLSDAGLELC